MRRIARNIGWVVMVIGAFLLWQGVTTLAAAMVLMASASMLPLAAVVAVGLAVF